MGVKALRISIVAGERSVNSLTLVYGGGRSFEALTLERICSLI